MSSSTPEKSNEFSTSSSEENNVDGRSSTSTSQSQSPSSSFLSEHVSNVSNIGSLKSNNNHNHTIVDSIGASDKANHPSIISVVHFNNDNNATESDHDAVRHEKEDLSIETMSSATNSSKSNEESSSVDESKRKHNHCHNNSSNPSLPHFNHEESSDSISSPRSDTTENSNSSSSSAQYSEKLYDPSEFNNLKVSPEIQELFPYITKYKPSDVSFTLKTKLKCFIPSYIPSIGNIDCFVKPIIKINEDSGFPELGMEVIDEALPQNQSDAALLELKLRSNSKKVRCDPKKNSTENNVRSIQNANKKPAQVERWIKNIQELHKQQQLQLNQKQEQTTSASKFPSIEVFMEPWDSEFLNELSSGDSFSSKEINPQVLVPNPQINLSLAEYAKVVCTLLDIPVYDGDDHEFVDDDNIDSYILEQDEHSSTPRKKGSIIESVHFMMNLYMACRDNNNH